MHSPEMYRRTAWRVFTPALVCIFFALGSLAAAQQAKRVIPYEDLRRPRSAEFHHTPIGLCEDYPEETTNLQVIRNDMEILKKADVHLLRIAFGWDGIEGERGKYNWLFWDDYVKIAVDEYGITLIPYICYTPAWNSTGDTSNYWNHTPKDYEAFGTFVSTIVNRYKNRIRSWELWNEPDIKAYWSGTAADLARLVKIGAQAVRKADPTATVVLAGLAGETNFLQTLFREEGISPFVDVVNIHSYFETWNNGPVESVVGYINTVDDIVKRYGNHQPIWMAEVGYSNFRTDTGQVSYHVWSMYDYEHTPAFQANYMFRLLTMSLSTEKLSAIAWYRIKDLPPPTAVIGDVNNKFLGVVKTDYTPKPAMRTISFFNTLFAGKVRCIDSAVTVRKSAYSDVELHCFQTEQNERILVAWLKTHVPGRIDDQPLGNRKDTRRETIAVQFSGYPVGRATRYDEAGNARPFLQFTRNASGSTIGDLTIAGGELVIITFVQ